MLFFWVNPSWSENIRSIMVSRTYGSRGLLSLVPAPDGRRIAFTRQDGLHIANADGSDARPNENQQRAFAGIISACSID